MDCPAEENLIRMKLEGFSGVESLAFDLNDRKLSIFHRGSIRPIETALKDLNLGSSLLSTVAEAKPDARKHASQRKSLWAVLAINFGFFGIELTTGLISASMGLIADSLDMLADSLVYGISLLAVGSAVGRKKKVARLAGYFQIVLAAIGVTEGMRRFFESERMPDVSVMITVSVLALLANAICLYILQKSKSRNEAHMKASMIFTSNDIIINTGVILAGIMVYYLNSNIPDLIIGSIVFLVVMRGAYRILKLGR